MISSSAVLWCSISGSFFSRSMLGFVFFGCFLGDFSGPSAVGSRLGWKNPHRKTQLAWTTQNLFALGMRGDPWAGSWLPKRKQKLKKQHPPGCCLQVFSYTWKKKTTGWKKETWVKFSRSSPYGSVPQWLTNLTFLGGVGFPKKDEPKKGELAFFWFLETEGLCRGSSLYRRAQCARCAPSPAAKDVDLDHEMPKVRGTEGRFSKRKFSSWPMLGCLFGVVFSLCFSRFFTVFNCRFCCFILVFFSFSIFFF